jgi:hypothetical protein
MAGSTSAALLDVVISTDITRADFVSGTDTVFGVAPADFTYSLTLSVDTSAGPPSFAAAGDPTDTFVFAHDVYGYNVVSATATFGSKTWDSADFVTLSFGDGISASKLFVDRELIAGAAVNLASVRLQDSDGFLFVGVRSCGATCQINEDFQIRDFNGGALDASNDNVSTNNYSVVVHGNEIPEPASGLLMAAGLVGLLGASARARFAEQRPREA